MVRKMLARKISYPVMVKLNLLWILSRLKVWSHYLPIYPLTFCLNDKIVGDFESGVRYIEAGAWYHLMQLIIAYMSLYIELVNCIDSMGYRYVITIKVSHQFSSTFEKQFITVNKIALNSFYLVFGNKHLHADLNLFL